MRSSSPRIWVVPAIVVMIVIILDQLSKAWILRTLGDVEGASMPLLGDWLKFTYVRNTGVAFGMFQNLPGLFTITSILISIGALYFYRYQLPNRHPVVQLCVGGILGGAIGNIIDRVRFGYVVDFVHVTWFPGIFNLADSCISVGVVILAAFLLREGEEPKRAAPPADDSLLGDLLTRDSLSQPGDRKP